MKRLLTLLALVLCSCAETFVGEDIARPNGENIPDLTAAFAEDDTRTYVENDKYLRWHEDDRLTAFYGNTLNRQYKFNGATGDNSGTFSLVPSGELGTGNAFDRIYALYPYSETAKITDEGEISLTLPAVQNYAENSFGRGANTMIAVTENLEDTFLAFKNACGYLKLKLYDPDGGELKSIEVKGNNGEKIAGSATATIAFGEVPVLNMSDDATTTITIDCGDGIAIGQTAETATEIWVVLPETTFTKGLTIVVTDTNGSIFEKSTEKEVVIERNAVQPMAALIVECNIQVPNNQIWYTSKGGHVSPYSSKAIDANIISHTYRYIDIKNDIVSGIITFDKDITTIGDYAFYTRSSLLSIVIPNSVKTIGKQAFERCLKLETINIPDNVTSIGVDAFYYCIALKTIYIPGDIKTLSNIIYGCKRLEKFYGKFASKDNRCLICEDEVVSFATYGLETYSIPNGVRKIGDNAFYCCSLNNLLISDSVEEIGEYAFYNSDLMSIDIPSNVQTIGFAAFGNNHNLKQITMHEGLKTIERCAFYGTPITSITFPNSVISIGSGVVCGCENLLEIKGKYASSDNRYLSMNGEFLGLVPVGITEYYIPEGISVIGKSSFDYIDTLVSIVLPSTIERIEAAFYHCDSLINIFCKAKTPPVVYYKGGNFSFPVPHSGMHQGYTIYVPAQSYDIYTQYTSIGKEMSQDNWYFVKEYIQPYDFE